MEDIFQGRIKPQSVQEPGVSGRKTGHWVWGIMYYSVEPCSHIQLHYVQLVSV